MGHAHIFIISASRARIIIPVTRSWRMHALMSRAIIIARVCIKDRVRFVLTTCTRIRKARRTMTTTMLGCNLRLSDVHAMAETVGREFKKLTDSFGMQCAMGLVPPVLEALEQLEVYVESYQQLQTRLSELQMDNDTVAYEREQKAKLADENEVNI